MSIYGHNRNELFSGETAWELLVEKLWRKLKQDQLHLRPWAEDLPTLRQQILSFFRPFETGFQELLSSVGLHLPY